jgi:acyl carrier protein
MAEDNRLTGLLQAFARIAGRSLPAAEITFDELDINSHHLVELMMACDEIYGAEVPFELLDITAETTITALHHQISNLLG